MAIMMSRKALEEYGLVNLRRGPPHPPIFQVGVRRADVALLES